MTSPATTGDEASAALARRLVRAADRAALATVLPDGPPYASLVMLAADHDGTPLLLLSDLAQHTRNIRANPAVSLLCEARDAATAGEDPMAGARLSLLGTAAPAESPGQRARFLARHPGYADFADFHCFRVTPSRAHLVAGFGRIRWIEREALTIDTAPLAALIAAEADIVAHMNTDHSDVLNDYAGRILGLGGHGPDGRRWVMTGIDREGIDLRLGARTARLDFAAPVTDPAAARAELVRLARLARE